jgi:hypothetical protein
LWHEDLDAARDEARSQQDSGAAGKNQFPAGKDPFRISAGSMHRHAGPLPDDTQQQRAPFIAVVKKTFRFIPTFFSTTAYTAIHCFGTLLWKAI